MTNRAEQRRRAPTITRALLALVLALALWLVRPSVPTLPPSFSAPLTIETIEGVALWLLWLIGSLLALTLVTRARRKAPATRSRLSRPRERSTRSTLRAARPRSESPSLVIVSPECSTHASAGRQGRADAGELPADMVDDAPLQDATARLERPRISVLGPLAITGGKRSRRGLRARALELIAYLALHPRPVHRDELLEAFWPGEDPRRTRPRLRQAVHDARRLLGDAIAGEGEQYRLDRAQVDVDLDELERLLTQANAEPERGTSLLDRALSLFRGEALGGSDYAWSENEVPRLRATFVDLLEQIGRRRQEAGEARAALDLAARGLDVDPLNEKLWRLAMEAESELGLREAVAQRYERLSALLDERLGLEPAQETRQLHRRLLAQS